MIDSKRCNLFFVEFYFVFEVKKIVENVVSILKFKGILDFLMFICIGICIGKKLNIDKIYLVDI